MVGDIFGGCEVDGSESAGRCMLHMGVYYACGVFDYSGFLFDSHSVDIKDIYGKDIFGDRPRGERRHGVG